MKKHHKYFILCSVLYSVCLVVVVLLFLFCPPVLSFVLCLLMGLPCKFLVTLFANKIFISILSNELDAQKFYNTIYQKNMRPPIVYQLNAEWYIGNYQKLIALSSAGYKNAKSVRWKCVYLLYLARSYFDVRDYEHLAETVDAFYQLQKDKKKKQKLLLRYPIFQYYKAYLNRDFEKCISLTQMRMGKIQKNRINGKLQWLTTQSDLAVAYYELGNIDKSKEIFEWFIETTPKLNNFYNLSVMYNNAIEEKNAPCSTFQWDEEDAAKIEQAFLSLERKRQRNRRILCILIVFCVVVLTAFECIKYTEKLLKQKAYNAALVEYEKDLNTAISTYYHKAKFIKYFAVRDGEQHIDTFCLIDVGDRLDLASVVTYDGGETLDLIQIVEDVQILHDYYVKSAVGNRKITFCISDKQLNDSDYKDIIEYSRNNLNYWIGIKDISNFTNSD